MKRKIEFGVLLVALILLLAQAAGAQGQDVVKFEETEGELQGQIFLAEPGSGLLIGERNAIPYSFKITPATVISVGYQKATLENVAVRKGQTVTVKFRATRNGNLAREISVPWTAGFRS